MSHLLFLVSFDPMLARDLIVMASSVDTCKRWVMKLKKRAQTAAVTSALPRYVVGCLRIKFRYTGSVDSSKMLQSPNCDFRVSKRSVVLVGGEAQSTRV